MAKPEPFIPLDIRVFEPVYRFEAEETVYLGLTRPYGPHKAGNTITAADQPSSRVLIPALLKLNELADTDNPETNHRTRAEAKDFLERILHRAEYQPTATFFTPAVAYHAGTEPDSLRFDGMDDCYRYGRSHPLPASGPLAKAWKKNPDFFQYLTGLQTINSLLEFCTRYKLEPHYTAPDFNLENLQQLSIATTKNKLRIALNTNPGRQAFILGPQPPRPRSKLPKLSPVKVRPEDLRR